MISKYNTAGVPCVKVYALGGLDENGKNLYCIETPDSIFVIEAGSKYPDITNPGIDIVIPDFSYLEQNKKKVKAVIISHGHDDVYAALPFLLKKIGFDVPIYTTLTTKIIIEEDYGARYKNFNFRIIKPSDDILISGYPFHFFSTSHAVMESFGFSIETQAGNIVYTGNYITDYGAKGHFTMDIPKIAKISEEKNTLLMLCESTAAEKPGIASPTHKITPHIKNLIEEGEKRVFIAVYNQNLYVISEIIKLAIANNKRIVITNKKLLDVLPQFIGNGDLIIPRNNQCAIEEVNKYPSKDLIVLITGSGEEIFNTIISLAREESKLSQYLRITPEDAFVMACPPAPSIETLATDAEDELYKTNCEVVFIKKQDISSMHAQQEDIKMMVSIFHPKYYMPIQGEFRLMMANAKIAESLGYPPSNIFLLDNGMALSFDRAGNVITPVNQLFKPGSTFIDGLGVGDVKSNIIDERNAMASSGVIIITSYYSSSKGELIGDSKLTIKGLVNQNESIDVVKQVNHFVNQLLERIINEKPENIDNLKNKAIDNMSNEIKKLTSKTPLICLNIIDVDKQ